MCRWSIDRGRIGHRDAPRAKEGQMERIRAAIDAAILTVVIRFLGRRVRADRRKLTARQRDPIIEPIRAEIADRAQVLWSAALQERPALAELVSHLPLATLTEAVVAAKPRRGTRQTVIRALILTTVLTALSITVATLVQRRRAARSSAATEPPAPAVTGAPAKELVAIPIVTAEEPAVTAQAAEPGTSSEALEGQAGEPARAATSNGPTEV
jgi:hypothetical protein